MMSLAWTGNLAQAGGNDQGGNGGGGKAALTAQWMWSIANVLEHVNGLDQAYVINLRHYVGRLPLLFCEGRREVCRDIFSKREDSPYYFVRVSHQKRELLVFNQRLWDGKTMEQKFEILLGLFLNQLPKKQGKKIARAVGDTIVKLAMRPWEHAADEIRREDHISSKTPRELAVGMRDFLKSCEGPERGACLMMGVFFREVDDFIFEPRAPLRTGVTGTNITWPVTMMNRWIFGGATIGHKIMVDVERFKGLDPMERIALMAHEVMSLGFMDGSHSYIIGPAFGANLMVGLNQYFKQAALAPAAGE